MIHKVLPLLLHLDTLLFDTSKSTGSFQRTRCRPTICPLGSDIHQCTVSYTLPCHCKYFGMLEDTMIHTRCTRTQQGTVKLRDKQTQNVI